MQWPDGKLYVGAMLMLAVLLWNKTEWIWVSMAFWSIVEILWKFEKSESGLIKNIVQVSKEGFTSVGRMSVLKAPYFCLSHLFWTLLTCWLTEYWYHPDLSHIFYNPVMKRELQARSNHFKHSLILDPCCISTHTWFALELEPKVSTLRICFKLFTHYNKGRLPNKTCWC